MEKHLSTAAMSTTDRHYQDGQRRTLSIDEVAKRLGIDRSNAYRLARRDELPIPVIRIGRRLFVSEAALDLVLTRLHAEPEGGGHLDRLVG